MSDMSNQPLSQLALSLMDEDTAAPLMREERSLHMSRSYEAEEHSCSHGWWSFILLFLLIAIVVYFLYFALRPSFVLKKNCHSDSRSGDDWEEIDNGRLLGAAVLTALVLIFLVWILHYLVH
jgi:hypothetical protein